MEEAYTALYQEFLRLRSVCLQQATMLRHLTEALNDKQGVNGDSTQCSQDDLINLCSDAQLQFHRHRPNQCAETNGNHGGHGVTADLLTSEMDQLQMAPVQPQAPPVGGGAEAGVGADAACGLEGPSYLPDILPARGPSSIIEGLRRVEQQWAENNPTRARKPWSSSSFLDSEWHSLTGGRVMSRVTRVTRVCEFCQAVFPGHTTTRGDFLRHLTSHIT